MRIRRVRAETYLGLGCFEEARAEAEAVPHSADPIEGALSLTAQARARIAAVGGEAKEAVEDLLSRASSLAQQGGAVHPLPKVHKARSEMASALGDEAKRRAELSEARRLYTEMGATGHAERVARELTAAAE